MVFSITLSLQRIEVIFCYSFSDSMGIQESQDLAPFPLTAVNSASLRGRLDYSLDAFGLAQDKVYLSDIPLIVEGCPVV